MCYKLTVLYGNNEVELCHFREKITREQLEYFIRARHKSVLNSPVDFKLFLDDIINLLNDDKYKCSIPIHIREFYDMPSRENPVFFYTAKRYDELLGYFQVDTSEILTYKIHKIDVYDDMKQFNDKY